MRMNVYKIRTRDADFYVLGTTVEEAIYLARKYYQRHWNDAESTLNIAEISIAFSGVIVPKDIDFTPEEKEDIVRTNTPLEELDREIDLSD
jgi:hypothetical protein